MKNLKKILIVIAMLALLVSSVVVVISAEDEEAVGAAKLEELIATVEAQESDAKKAGKLVDVYTYYAGYEWEGTEYADAMAKADALTVSVGQGLLAQAVATGRLPNKLTAVQNVLAHLAACPVVDAETEGYAALVAETYALYVEVLDAHYELDTTADMMTLYESLELYALDADVHAEELAKWSLKAYDQLCAWLDEYCAIPEWDGTTTSVDYDENYFPRITEILLIQNFVETVDVSAAGAAAVTETMALYSSKLAARNAELESAKNFLDSQSSFDAYDLGDYYTLNTFESENDKLFPGHNSAGDHQTVRETETLGGVTNSYQAFNYGTANVHLYTHCDAMRGKTNEDGAVIDMDIRVHSAGTEAFASTMTINFQSLDYTVNPQAAQFTDLFKLAIKSDGTIYVTNSQNSPQNAQDPSMGVGNNRIDIYGVAFYDIWQHYTVVFNADENRMFLYIDYKYIMELPCHMAGRDFSHFRFGPGVINSWDGWDVDNFHMYRGQAFRITDKFSSMTDAQRFNYFVEYATNTYNPYLSRNLAYKKANLLLNAISNKAECKEAIETFKAINYDAEIKVPAMADNLELLAAEVDELLAIEVMSSNVAAINKKISEINAFVSENSELIDKANTAPGGYQELMGKVYAVQADLVKIENVAAFVEAIEKFDRATTYVALSRHYETARQIYAIAEYDNPENVAFVANDPVVLAFENAYNNGALTEEDEGYLAPGDEGYVTLFEYYDTFDDIIMERYRYENSKKIVNSIDYVTSLDGYEAAEEFWAANADAIESYMVVIRRIVRDGAYDAEYEGVAEAIEIFWDMELYFYKALQNEHIAYLNELLARYPLTDSYVEKNAIYLSAQSYLATEDIALYNDAMPNTVRYSLDEQISALRDVVAVVESYKVELEGDPEADDDGYVTSFDNILTQQTQYFINIINHMDTLTKYSELLSCFEEASKYYYGINTNVEGAAEAAEKYATYRSYLAYVEECNAMLLVYASDLEDALKLSGMEKRTAVYQALKECAAYVGGVDEYDEDVAEALALYEAQVAAYNASLDAFDSALSESAQFISAVRSTSISATVLAIVGNIVD